MEGKEFLGKVGNYRIKIIIIIGITFCIGCVKHIDFISPFHISGKVLNANNNTPLEDVEIYFIDRGLDSIGSKDAAKGTHRIGLSEEEGKFKVTFKYWWGYEKGFLKKTPTYVFDLMFRKEGYADKIVSYDYKKLPYKNDLFQVDVGTITLMPEEK